MGSERATESRGCRRHVRLHRGRGGGGVTTLDGVVDRKVLLIRGDTALRRADDAVNPSAREGLDTRVDVPENRVARRIGETLVEGDVGIDEFVRVVAASLH